MARLENQNGSLESNTIHWSFSKVDFFFFFLVYTKKITQTFI